MGSIQSSVNQILGQAAILSALHAHSPAGKAKAELRTLNQKEKTLSTMYKAGVQKSQATGIEDTETFGEVNRQQSEINKRRFELRPTMKNARRMLSLPESESMDDMVTTVSPGEMASSRAMQHMADAQSQKRARRNFMTYLREQPMSIGGKVGDMPQNIQKQIAAHYGPKQRKALMDQMDREAKK